MAERYPGYDVLAKWDTVSWNDATRRVIAERLAVEDRPAFLELDTWQTLKALCERIMPQVPECESGRSPAPPAAYVDRKLLHDSRDGYRDARLPPLREAWMRGLNALEAEARTAYVQAFHVLHPDGQDALIMHMARGELKDRAWGDMPCDVFFTDRVRHDICLAYYAHPNAWSEIGFGGPAGPRGYVRLSFDRRDRWEAQPTAEANARVGR